jgi:hypothetical protein
MNRAAPPTIAVRMSGLRCFLPGQPCASDLSWSRAETGAYEKKLPCGGGIVAVFLPREMEVDAGKCVDEVGIQIKS